MRRLPFEVANEKLLPLEFLMPIKYADAAGCSAASSPLGLPSLLANPRGQLTLTLGKCCGAPQDQVCSTKLQLSQLGCLSREFTIKYDGLAFVCCLASSCLCSFPSSPSPLTPSLCRFSIWLPRPVVRCVIRYLCSLIPLPNRQPFVCVRDLCTTFVFYSRSGEQKRREQGQWEKGQGTIRPGHKLAAQDAPLNNNYDNNKSKISCAAVA